MYDLIDFFIYSSDKKLIFTTRKPLTSSATTGKIMQICMEKKSQKITNVLTKYLRAVC